MDRAPMPKPVFNGSIGCLALSAIILLTANMAALMVPRAALAQPASSVQQQIPED
jgi:hypothetical protein